MIKKYLRFEIVSAEPMGVKEAKKKSYVIESRCGNGYEVTFKDGCKSWCPKYAFDNNNIEIKNNSMAYSVPLMFSDDYRSQFVSEYIQISIRAKKLKLMIEKIESGSLKFTPLSPIEMLKEQLKSMETYINFLEFRSRIEKIEIPKID
jgi:hypothetical protein